MKKLIEILQNDFAGLKTSPSNEKPAFCYVLELTVSLTRIIYQKSLPMKTLFHIENILVKMTQKIRIHFILFCFIVRITVIYLLY